MDPGDAQRVLHRNRGDRRGRISTQQGDGLDVSLNARSAAGVGTCNDQDAAGMGWLAIHGR